ncbi:Probable Co/Zn/Cd efflux system membrane fusion protein [hydrothermal vent metagenome]|uniref:Probable Co/Zn/Cd efflux system membrane fusion protein n=1 Tax=hydrothermal vent metagenome TaxID=652676 RepID=A0A3B1C3J3_9ZZZZ
MNKNVITLIFCSLIISLPCWGAAGDESKEEGKSSIKLSEAEREATGIVVEVLQVRPMVAEIQAPGEIHLNAYATTKATPRIAAQVLTRHKRLGETVETGQPLVTLSSVDMGEAQGVLLVADIEWRRVTKLGRKVVSERRYVEAQVARQQAYARVRAYGMTKAQTNRLLKTRDPAKATGEFKLLSGQDGIIIHDDFTVGELVEPGRVLFEITDPSTIWVEAKLSVEQEALIHPGAQARIKTNSVWINGKVLQLHPMMDETTRTQGVRIEFRNESGHLHPGRFVEVYLQTDETGKSALAVPDTALMRSPDGDLQLFIETKPGEFEPQEVEVLRRSAGLAEIEGLEPGTRIVTQGAFFLQSELAKAGFNIHNH